MVLDTEQSDPWQGHSPLGTHPQNYYCQAPGWYLAEAFVPWQYTTASPVEFSAGIGVNTAGGLTTYQGQLQDTQSGQNPGVFAADLVQMLRTGAPDSAGSDFVQLQAYTSGSGIHLDGSGPNFPRLSVRWAGTGAASSLAIPGNAAFPVPPAYVDATWLNANIRDALKFLSNPPLFRATHTAAGGDLPSGTWPSGTVIPVDNVTVDNYSASTGTSWVAPAAGIHYICAQAGTELPTGTAAVAAGVKVNSTTTWGQAVFSESGTSTQGIATASGRFRLSAGDTVSLAGFQNSGATQISPVSKLIIAWESA